MKRQLMNHKIALVTILLAGVMVLGGGARADIHLAMMPSSVTVDPGDFIDIELTITEAGSAFNGYDAVIGFDPDLLDFIVQSVDQQEGPLMTNLCPNRFHDLEYSPSEGILIVHHVLLCAGVSTTGPGVVYRLRFQAGMQDAVTQISVLEGTAFFLAGSEVTPLTSTDASITILNVSDAPGIPDQSALRLQAAPNPFNPLTRLSFDVTEPGNGQLDVYTADGRRIKQLAQTYLDADHHEFWWDGTNDGGQAVGSGVYFVRLRVGNESAMRPVTLVK